MGVYNEQGAVLEEPEDRPMLVKQAMFKGGSSRCQGRRQLSRLPPKDVLNDMMFVEQFACLTLSDDIAKHCYLYAGHTELHLRDERPPLGYLLSPCKAVGGWTPDDPSCLVEQFCPDYNEWKTAACMVNRRGNVAVGTLDGQIYTVGGEDNVRCYSNVERYNPDTDSWSTDAAPLSSPRSGVCLVAMDGYLYAIGGHDGITAMNTVERYDPKMNMWSKQAAMLTRRTRAVAAVLEGHLYVIGGNDGDMALSSVERYNPVDGTWSICAHMLSPRENAGCAVYLGHIYVAGGKDELSLELCAAERFNPDTMRWTPVKRLRSKRDNMSLVVFGGALLAVGGSDGLTTLKTIEVYCHETNSWRHFGSMKSKHPGGRVAVLC